MRALLLGAVLLAVASATAAAESYTIRLQSPQSWSEYYRIIGLGHTVAPPSEAAAMFLVLHCGWLEDITGHRWVALGYSAQRGLALCYRTSPYSRREAKVLCARLVMQVAHTGEQAIICRGGGILHLNEQPFLNGPY